MSVSAVPIALVDEGLGNSSYIIDIGERRALVLDPSRDPAPYLAATQRRKLTIAFAAETHLHADFVSGSRELAARNGVQVLASAAGGIEFPHRGLGHGDEVDLGGLTLRALATPGHTPEHLSYLLLDGARPLALFSGGSLLVGAVARTDLIAPERTEELARALWRSLNETILGLPDDLHVYPTHGAGSFCSSPAGGERTTTIGREKQANPMLAAPDEDAFVQAMLGLGSFPPYFLRLREVNRRGPRVYGPELQPLAQLSVDELRALLADGAQLVDVRPIESFAAGHIDGALSIELRPSFATWLGWFADPSRPLVFVVDDTQDRRELVVQVLKVGYERLAGELGGGMRAWEAAGLPVRRLRLVPAARPEGRVIDVRQASEFEAGHIPGSIHVELGSVPRHVESLGDGPTTVMCEHGLRAMTGASLLEAQGRRDVAVAIGGPSDWAVANRRRLEGAA